MDAQRDTPYDVAISFLSADEPVALKLHEQLSESLSVFVYSKQQEQLAGTDGLESFRQAFLSQSRLVIVLYRDGWGKTRWTTIEELAIKERMFEGGWESLLFVMMDKQSRFPAWLPKTHIRLDYTNFASDLVGAIKLRAQELGSELKVETAVDKAKRMNAIALVIAERNQKLTYEASAGVLSQWATLCRLVEDKIEEIGPHFELEYSKDELGYIVRTKLASIQFTRSPFNSSESQMRMHVFLGHLILHEELGLRMHMPGNEPQRISEYTFQFDYNAAYGWCWRSEIPKEQLLTTEALSEFFITTILETHERVEAGELVRKQNPRYPNPRHRRTAWS